MGVPLRSIHVYPHRGGQVQSALVPPWAVVEAPSLVGDEVPIQGEDVEDTAATRAVLGANDTGCRSLEGSGGKDGDPL
jgi:hypothetical protein